MPTDVHGRRDFATRCRNAGRGALRRYSGRGHSLDVVPSNVFPDEGKMEWPTAVHRFEQHQRNAVPLREPKGYGALADRSQRVTIVEGPGR